jgi:hypothetical protein
MLNAAMKGSTIKQIETHFDVGTLAGMPDGLLLERFTADRDGLAFEAIVARHGRALRPRGPDVRGNGSPSGSCPGSAHSEEKDDTTCLSPGASFFPPGMNGDRELLYSTRPFDALRE